MAGMIGAHLHKYDLEICNYVIGNIVQYMNRPAFRAELEAVLTSRPLLHYLKQAQIDSDTLDADEIRLLLNDDELYRLELVFEDDLNLPWCASEPLHRRYIETVQEVRDNISRQAAEDWSEVCAKFGKQLEDQRTRLLNGIAVIREWAGRLRTLLRVMGAVAFLPAPEGGFPTPTCPQPPPLSCPPVVEMPLPEQPDGHSTTTAQPALATTLSQLTDALNQITTSTTSPTIAPEALSKEDAARFLGVSIPTIEYLIRTRKIEYVQLGSQRGRVIPVDALRKLLQDNIQITGEEELHRRRGRR
jgi:excisionase family DNA binding protein